MTIQEFHIAFNIELDKTLDFEYPYMQPEQIDYWLNKAQERFIKQRLYPKDKRQPGFEENQKRIDDLRSIVKVSSVITPIADGELYRSELPNDYQHLIRHRCKTSEPICGVKKVGGIEIQQDDINTLLKDPFWQPIAEEPLFYFNGTEIVYETRGTFQVLETQVTYVKRPSKLKLGSAYSQISTDSDCELSEETHSEILDIAIAMVLENIESQRYQSNLNELNKTE